MRRLPHLEHCRNQTAQHLQTVLPFGELLTIAWPIIGKSDVIHKKTEVYTAQSYRNAESSQSRGH